MTINKTPNNYGQRDKSNDKTGRSLEPLDNREIIISVTVNVIVAVADLVIRNLMPESPSLFQTATALTVDLSSLIFAIINLVILIQAGRLKYLQTVEDINRQHGRLEQIKSDQQSSQSDHELNQQAYEDLKAQIGDSADSDLLPENLESQDVANRETHSSGN